MFISTIIYCSNFINHINYALQFNKLKIRNAILKNYKYRSTRNKSSIFKILINRGEVVKNEELKIATKE